MKTPACHRTQARRKREGRHQQSLQAYRVGEFLRRQHARDRSRAAETSICSRGHALLTSSIAAKSSCAAPAFYLRKAEERAETLEGYLIALANLDEFIHIIRGSANREEARVKLLAFEFSQKPGRDKSASSSGAKRRLTDGRYAFSEHQADQILDLRLYQLTGLEREKITGEYSELLETHQ